MNEFPSGAERGGKNKKAEGAICSPPGFPCDLSFRMKPDGRRGENRVRSFYADILTALAPVVIWAVYLYGARVITVVAVSAAVSVASEYLLGRLLKMKPEITDLRPLVSGITVSLFLPVSVPLYIPAAAALISSVFVRVLIRGNCTCRLDPVSSAVCASEIIFHTAFGTVCGIFCRLPALDMSVTVPLTESAEQLKSQVSVLASGLLPSETLTGMFFGFRTGAIGEASAFLIIAAGIFLLCRKVIRPTLPVTAVVVLAILCYAFPQSVIESDFIALQFAGCNILVGNLLLAAVFAAAMPGVAPQTRRGSLVAGALLGGITFLVRYFIPEAHSDALIGVLAVSLLSRPLDLIFAPHTAGGTEKQK